MVGYMLDIATGICYEQTNSYEGVSVYNSSSSSIILACEEGYGLLQDNALNNCLYNGDYTMNCQIYNSSQICIQCYTGYVAI